MWIFAREASGHRAGEEEKSQHSRYLRDRHYACKIKKQPSSRDFHISQLDSRERKRRKASRTAANFTIEKTKWIHYSIAIK
jgi:hypothetical protein